MYFSLLLWVVSDIVIVLIVVRPFLHSNTLIGPRPPLLYLIHIVSSFSVKQYPSDGLLESKELRVLCCKR